MKKKLVSLLTTISLIAAAPVAIAPVHAASNIIAFPGAEGAGKYATGGRGGNIVHVTNLNDSGTGSFRDAVSGSNRIVVFDVGGTIELKSDVVIKGNITIAGQTAPGGGGITLKNYKLGMGGDNIIIRYVSSRPGEGGKTECDGWGGSNGSNSIVDHCATGWANDEQFALYSNNMNQTVQYSVIGPSNCISYHAKGAHGFGVMFGRGQNSWHHNMIAHNISRNFRGKVVGTETMDFVNNVIYNWGYQTGYGTLGHINYVNNYLKAGPSTRGGYHFMKADGSDRDKYKFYMAGNKVVNPDGSGYNAAMNENNWNGGIQYCEDGNGYTFTEADYRTDTPFSVKDVNGNNASVMSGNVESAEDAFNTVISYAGPGVTPDKRPKIDKEVMEQAKTGTGALSGGRDFDGVTESDLLQAIEKYDIVHMDYDAYYPPQYTTKEIVDSDNDGMPDEWEIARGLNPNSASDAKGDYLGQGYNNIEYYINDLTIDSFPEGVVTESPVTADLGPEYNMIKEDIAALKLGVSSVKEASDITLPQKGSVNNLDIVWSSSSSAIKLSNNQVASVTRKNTDQTVTLTATISYGGYTMNKTFNVTVVSSNTFWKASKDIKAGSELFDGLTALFDGTYSQSQTEVSAESFSGYVSSSENGTFGNGVATGTAFKYTAAKTGFITAYVATLGSASSVKTLYITEEGASGNKDCVASIGGNGENTALSARVEAGKTYYIYAAGTKGRFLGIQFSNTAQPVWWKASAAAAAGQELMPGLYASEAFNYTESAREIDGVSFSGGASGTTNPTENGAVGAAVKYVASKSGILTVYCKVNAGKTFVINDANGNIVTEYKNEESGSKYASFNGTVEAGKTYYAYVKGSKAEFCGVSFVESAVQPTMQPTSSPTTQPTEPPKPTTQPTSSPTTQPTSSPTTQPTELPEPTTPPSDGVDMDFIKDGVSIDKLSDGNIEIAVTMDNTEGKKVYAAQYDSNGHLISVTVRQAQASLSIDVNVLSDTNELKAMAWDGMEAVSEVFKISR